MLLSSILVLAGITLYRTFYFDSVVHFCLVLTTPLQTRDDSESEDHEVGYAGGDVRDREDSGRGRRRNVSQGSTEDGDQTGDQEETKDNR